MITTLRKTVSKHDVNQVKEDAMEGKCVVLDLVGDEKYVYAYNDSVRLERKEAEVLGCLMDHVMISCSEHSIEQSIWYDRPVGNSAVKRYIASLRRKLDQAMGSDDIAENILVTTEEGYAWKTDIPSIVLRNG